MADYLKAWRKLRIDIEIARTYEKAICARNNIATAGKLPWVDEMMATLLFIRVMELHDDALQELLQERKEVVPKKFGGLMKGRLNYIHATWKRSVDSRLLKHADRRNELSHEIHQHASWNELACCIEDVQESLVAMACIPQPITSIKSIHLLDAQRLNRMP